MNPRKNARRGHAYRELKRKLARNEVAAQWQPEVFVTPEGKMNKTLRTVLILIGTLVLIGLCLWGTIFVYRQVRSDFAPKAVIVNPTEPAVVTKAPVVPTDAPTAVPTAAPTEAPTEAAPVVTEAPVVTKAPIATEAIATEAATAAPIVIKEINYNEPLNGTLDDFGNATRYSDRFALNGTILDESLNAGEMIFGNAYALHDNGWVGESCVVFYYKAPSEGGRVRATGFDGIFFTVDTNKMTLNQGIASMRQTLINAHACTFAEIKFHELTRYGDPVKK